MDDYDDYEFFEDLFSFEEDEQPKMRVIKPKKNPLRKFGVRKGLINPNSDNLFTYTIRGDFNDEKIMPFFDEYRRYHKKPLKKYWCE